MLREKAARNFSSPLDKNVWKYSYKANELQWNKRKDQPLRLATIGKIAQRVGYNLPNYSEKRTIKELLEIYGEYSYLTGKRLGVYYLSTLDIEIRNKKEKFPKKLIERLEKNTNFLLNHLKVSYDRTKKGLHIDILSSELLENQQIYYQGWGKTWNIGSIQSKDKYVVGKDSNKTFIRNGKWYWKIKENKEIRDTLNKFFFELGNSKKYQFRSYRTNLLSKRQNIEVQILKVKPTILENLSKITYLNWDTKQKNYCLVNDYHRDYLLPKFYINKVVNIGLTKGIKHNFLQTIEST